jgi:hypothetical protein
MTLVVIITQKNYFVKNLAKYGARCNTPVEIRIVRCVKITSFWYWNSTASLKAVRKHAIRSYQREEISITFWGLMSDLTRSTKIYEWNRHNKLKPVLQDLSARNFDISGFTGVVTVVVNT